LCGGAHIGLSGSPRNRVAITFRVVNASGRCGDYYVHENVREGAIMDFRRMLPFLALILLTNPAAAAPKPKPQDLKAVQTCLAGREGELGTKCIGMIADPCIKAAEHKELGSVDQDKANACAARELAVWEAQLETELKAVRAGGNDIIKAVADAQTTWRASREKLCPVFAKVEPGMLNGAADYCRLQETGRRVLLLRRLGEAVNPH